MIISSYYDEIGTINNNEKKQLIRVSYNVTNIVGHLLNITIDGQLNGKENHRLIR